MAVHRLGQPSSHRGCRRGAGGWAVAVASLVGIAAFGYPFLLPAVAGVGRSTGEAARAAETPRLLAALSGLALLAAAVELGRNRLDAVGSASKLVALLGALVAIDATLRLVPSFLGASPIFVLIILVGAVFGPSFGFLMGSLTLLLSAFLTGGVGPWLPYQMLGAGWVGLSAGWLPRPRDRRRRVLLLAAFGAGWGLLYGALLNLYSWPFAAPGLDQPVGLFWTPGLSLGETLGRYAAFYLTTSLLYDLFRAAGNAALLLALGAPLLRLLERYLARFAWQATLDDEPRQA